MSKPSERHRTDAELDRLVREEFDRQNREMLAAHPVTAARLKRQQAIERAVDDPTVVIPPEVEAPEPEPEPEPPPAFAREEIEHAAIEAGVAPIAVRDFVARVEHELPATPSAEDPTREHMALSEYVEQLRDRAPHLFMAKGNGHDHRPDPDRDAWESATSAGTES